MTREIDSLKIELKSDESTINLISSEIESVKSDQENEIKSIENEEQIKIQNKKEIDK